jgi:hypothetical protein
MDPKGISNYWKKTHHAIPDLGSSVSILSKELYELLELQNIEKCSIDLLLADDSNGYIVDLLPMLATIMKEEVIGALIMLLIISCKGMLLIFIGRLLFIVIHSYTKCVCIERKLDFVVITFVFRFSLYQVLTSQLL